MSRRSKLWALTASILLFSCQTTKNPEELTLFSGEPILNLLSTQYEVFQQGNYMAPLISLRDAASQYSERPEYKEVIGTYESFAGNYGKAQQYFGDENTKSRTQPGEAFEAKAAIPEIIAATRSRRVVFINESHHIPAHRALTTQLLSTFWKQGFRYFAAEALNDDAELNTRKYPLFGVTGHYINEPFFGDLIRQAQRIGFQIVPYEYRGTQDQREKGEAQNLYDRILKQDPAAKILVHAGYSHIAKIGTPEWTPMAKYFWQISGIEPYSIEQTRSIAAEVTRPTVFRSKEGQYWAGTTKNFDMAVIHPRDPDSTERPVWASVGGHRVPWKIHPELCRKSFPCLIQAFVEKEGIKAVPMDQIEVLDETQERRLMLPPGRYTLRSMTKDQLEVERATNPHVYPRRGFVLNWSHSKQLK